MVFNGNGMVWDAANDMPLCQFTEGRFETEDSRIIDILTELGYEIESPSYIDVEFTEDTKKAKKTVKEV